MVEVISIVCFVLAIICDAIMDTIQHHYHISIFRKYNEQYWDASISWLNKYQNRDDRNPRVKIRIFKRYFNKPVQLTDAWHLIKSIKIILILISMVSYTIVFSPILDFLILGVIWDLTFSLFYDKILKLGTE